MSNRTRGAIGAVLLGLGALWGAGALAEQHAPRPLLPPVVLPPSPPVEEEPAPGGIRTEPLPAPSLATAGLERPRFGFDEPLWPRAEGALVTALLERLRRLPPLPALRDLARRLLIAPGPAVPDGLPVLMARARALMRLGFPREAARLARLPGDEQSRLARERLALEALVLAGEVEEGCALAETLAPDGRGLLALRVVCAAVAGELERARLIWAVARERGVVLDEASSALLDAAVGEAAVPLEGMSAESRLAALVAARRLPLRLEELPPEMWADGPLLAALAENRKLAPALRLRAAEAAALRGWVAIPRLRELMTELAGGAAEGEREVMDRARTLAGLQAERLPAPRVSLLAEAAAMVPAGVERVVWLHLLSVEAEPLVPDPALLWAAESVAAVLMAGGRWEQARPWLVLAGAVEDGDADGDPVLALLGRRRGEGAAPVRGRRLVYRLALAAAWDRNPADAELAEALAAGPAEAAGAPGFGLWWVRERGLVERRPGEALIAALLMLEPPLESLSPLVLTTALRTLRAFGEEAAARELAAAVALALRL